MAWLSLLLALAALPASLLDRSAAMLLIAGAVAGGTVGLRQGRRRRLARSAIALALVGALVTGGLIIEFHRPVASASIDHGVYERAGEQREVLLPLTVRTTPITRLALLGFAKGSDPIYTGLEPQYIDDGQTQGWRILAYRVDGRVDVYDQPGLDRQDDDFAVIGEGLHRHVEVPIDNATIERDAQGRATIRAAFTDIEQRRVVIDIAETTTRRSTPTNILAPVGASARTPTSFPLFVLHDFEFLRLAGTRMEVTIDGAPIDLEGFPAPIPLQGQRRSFAKYTVDTEIIELFPTSVSDLRRVRTEPGSDLVIEDGVRYLFDGDALERIAIGETEVLLEPALDLTTTTTGGVTITPPPGFGRISGTYRVVASGSTAELTLTIDEVEVPRQRDVIYRLIVNRSTMFGTWPQGYHYQARFDLDTGTVDATWENTTPVA